MKNRLSKAEQFMKTIDTNEMIRFLTEVVHMPVFMGWPKKFRKGPRCEVIQAIPKMTETGDGVVATPILILGRKKITVRPWDIKVTKMWRVK